MLAAAVGGFVAGLFVGCVLGALLSWLAGAVLNWQNQLAFQLGVTETLLPLGQQVELLQEMQDDWWLVVPLVGFALGLPGALAAGLAAGLLAQLFNRFLPIDLTVEDVEDRPR
jgi:NhaP-type Na+/H+ or K+/H+ antiporter